MLGTQIEGSIPAELQKYGSRSRWDFAAILRRRPVWDAVVVALLGGLAVLSISGVWMAVRYVRRSLQPL